MISTEHTYGTCWNLWSRFGPKLSHEPASRESAHSQRVDNGGHCACAVTNGKDPLNCRLVERLASLDGSRLGQLQLELFYKRPVYLGLWLVDLQECMRRGENETSGER